MTTSSKENTSTMKHSIAIVTLAFALLACNALAPKPKAEFAPTTAYLKVYSQGTALGSEAYHWPAESLGFSLYDVGNGKWIEGEALAFAWRVVNENYYTPIESNGASFQLAVQVPGASFLEPPKP